MNLICDGLESVEGVNVLSSIPKQGLHPLLMHLLISLMNNGVNVSMIDDIRANSYSVNKLLDLLKSNKSSEVKEVGIRNILVNDMNVNV
nr:hypothetical protein [uncultured Flavobacterium sp.]